MIIAVNTRFLVRDKLEGIGYFVHETMKRITAWHPEHQFVFLFDRPYPDEFIFAKNVIPQIVSPPARHPLLWYWWFEHAVPRALKSSRADIFLSPDSFLSLRSTVKTALMVHDLAFEHFSDHVPYLTLKYYKHYIPRYARRADRIATNSEFSKQDLVEQYTIDRNKIDVVYSAAKGIFHPASPQDKNEIKQKYTGGNDYFIYVGTLQPRKNISNLLLSFEQFKKSTSSPVKLILAGRKGWHTAAIFDTYHHMQFKEDVIFLNYLSLDELVKVIGASLALLYVSLFEGFGVPVLEGMHAEVPVITSETSSLPEVAGDAALLVNPHSIDSIAAALSRIYREPGLRSQLVEKGRIQKQKFSWEDTAQKLWQCVEKIS